MSFPLTGLTDGMGTVVEEEEIDSFVNSVGQAVSSQWDVSPISPEGGGNYVPPAPDAGSSYFEEPAYDPWMDEQLATTPLPTPPPIQTGSQFFDGPGFTESAPGDSPWEPNITYVSNEDYFGSVGSPDPFGAGFTEQGPSDTLGTGFGTWLDNQINVAIRDGNEQQYNDLIALFNQQGEGPADLYLRGMMDQMGTPELQDTTIDPMAYFGIDRAGVRAGEMPGVFIDEARRQASADYWGLPSFAGQHGDPFASGQFEDYRDFAMTQGNLRFNNDASFLPGVIERGLGYAGTAFGAAAQGTGAALRYLGDTDLGGGLEISDVAKGAWFAINVGAERGWQATSYTAAGKRYLINDLVDRAGLPEEVATALVSSASMGNAAEGLANLHYREGDSLTSTVRGTYDTQPWYVRVGGETVVDPLNFVGIGLVAKGANAVTAGRRFKQVRRGTQEFIDAGWTSEQLVSDFISTKPSWRVTNKLHWADERVSDALISQTGIPVEDIANQALARNLVMEMHIASRGIDASDPIALARTIEATRTRVINEMVQKVEVKYGTKVANQVNRQLNTPAVQNAIAVVTSPNTIPVNNQIVLVSDDGKQITGIFTPGSGRQMFQTPGAGPVRVSQYSGSTTQTLTTPRVTFAPGSGRNQLPNGLTRRPTGEIVTVSRRVADDAVESAVSASQAADDVRVIQQTLDVPVAASAPDAPIVDTTLPDPVLEELLPPAPPRQTPDAFPEVSARQMAWLNAFSQRDGINYWDEIVATGDTSQAAVIAKLQEIDASGKATAAQIVKMGQLGVTPSRRRELMQLPRQQVDAELRRLEQGAPRPTQPVMTTDDFQRAFPDPNNRPFTDAQVMMAAKRSKEYGIDFLRRAVDEGWSPDQLAKAIDKHNLPPTPTMRKQIADLQAEGHLPKDLAVDALSRDAAQRKIDEGRQHARRVSSVEATMRHNAPAPVEVATTADEMAQAASDAKIAAQKKAQDYLTRHLPKFTAPPTNLPGYRKAVKGQKVANDGVEVMSPAAFRQWAVDIVDAKALDGTAFGSIVEEISQSILHVNADGLLSSDTVAAHFEYLVKQMIEMAGHAEPDDARRLIDALDEAYNGDRYKNITRMAGRKSRGVDEAEHARRVESARSMLPAIDADLADLRVKLNRDRGQYTPRQLDEFRAQRAKLEEQRDRALDLTNPKGKGAPKPETAQQTRQRKRQEAADKVRTIAPTIGELPPVEAPQSMAGLASDHDIAKLLVEGNVPAVERNHVVSATQPTLLNAPTAADEAARRFLQTPKGQQARNMFRGQGNTQGMLDGAFTNAGTTREAVEAALRQGGDIAAGGGLGIVDPRSQYVFDALGDMLPKRPRKLPNLIEPDADLWRNANWDAIGPQMDEWARQFYDVDWILEQDKRLRFLGREVNPAALQEFARMAQAGDFSSAFFQSYARIAHATPDGYKTMRDTLEFIVTEPDIKKVIQAHPFFGGSENGRETLRLLRRTGKSLLDSWESVLPHGSLTDLSLSSIFPAPVNGEWVVNQSRNPMKTIDDILNNRYTPKGLTWEQRDELRMIRNSDVVKRWNETVKPTLYEVGTGWKLGKVKVGDIDSILFDHSADIEDLGRLADRIGTRVSQEYAKIKNFDPDKVGHVAKMMMWTKAQLTPIWMTTVPGYFANNIFGNWMGHLLKAIKGDSGAGVVPRIVNGDVFDNPLSGFSYGNWITNPTAGKSQFTETAVAAASRNADGKYRPALLKVGKVRVPGTADLIDMASGGRLGGSVMGHEWKGAVSFGEDVLGAKPEEYAKKALYSQHVWSEVPKLWRGHLDTMMKQGKLTPDDVDKLVMAKGLHEVRSLGWKLDTPTAMDELLSRYQSVIGTSQYNAYRHAAEAMRDYRMRNKIDGFLDAYLPVHFWATKNMLFVTKAAMHRPALAISGAQAYNAWVAEHKDDPLSLAAGYVQLPAELASHIPFVGEGAEYWMRLTQITNPVFFAVPKLIAATNRDWQLQPEDQSLWDRVQYWGKNGMANFWEASGYRLGPQWDWAIKAANRVNQNPDGRDADIMFAANFLSSPYTVTETDPITGEVTGRRRKPGSQNVIPFGGWESLIRKYGIPGVDTGLGKKTIPFTDMPITAEATIQWLNQLATGSPYTNMEVAQAALWMKEDTFVNWSEENQIRLEEALAAMGQGNYDHPYIQQAMGNVMANSAEGFARNRLLMVSGREWTETNERVYRAYEYWDTLQEEGRRKEADLWSVQYDMPAELRWIVRDSGATQEQIDKAMAAARRGDDHPLLKKAREVTGTEEWAVDDQLAFGQWLIGMQRTYDRLVVQGGKDYAEEIIFGPYNRAKGQREGGEAPGMAALFMATSPERMFEDANQNLVNRRARALEDAYWAGVMEKNHKARPYFDKIAAADEALRQQVAKAGDNMYLVDLAYKSHSNITGRIYDEAEANGVEMGPSGNLPSQGSNYYTRTQEERNFLEWNGALEAVEGRERAQARQGFVLNLIAEQLGVKKYTEDGEINERFLTDGRFDEAKYSAALEEASLQAPELFREIVLDIRGQGGYIEMGVDRKGIRPEDFVYHLTASENPRLDAWREQRQADRSAYFDMPNETPEQRAAKDAEAARLRREYGEEFLDRTYKDTPDGTTAGDHRRYSESTSAVADFYHSMTPADKAAFKAQYPDAFVKDTFVNDQGETIEYDKFVASQLTGEQAGQIVQSNGLEVGPVRGDRADRIERMQGTPEERDRRFEAGLVEAKTNEFNGILTADDEMALEMFYSAKDHPRWAEAEELKNASLTKKGFPSWTLAKIRAGEAGDTEMVALIEQYQAAVEGAKPVWDKQEAWFDEQPDDVKETLIREHPNLFGRYSADDSAEQTVPATGQSGNAPTSSQSGGGGYSSNYRPYSSNYRSSGSSYRSGSSGFSGGSGAGSGDQPVLNQILSLDPFLSSGQDDGRLAIATQVSDHIQRMISVISMFAPDKRQAQFFTGLWMQLIGRMLGPNPDMAAWQALLARLTKQQQAAPPPPAETGPPPPPVEQGDVTQQQRSTLGGY
jgi:hypothetical protein